MESATKTKKRVPRTVKEGGGFSADNYLNEANLKNLLESERQLEKGNVVVLSLDSVLEM